MAPIWIASYIALWVLVLVETGLLLLLLRALGELREKGTRSATGTEQPQNGLNVGVQAPRFEATQPNGQNVRLQAVQEARVLVAFLSPGCSYCAEAIRNLNIIQECEPDLRVLLLGGTNQEANNAYAAEHESKLPLLTPVQQTVMSDYAIPGFPFAFVLDASHTIRAKGFAIYREQVEQLLSDSEENSDQAAIKQPVVHLS